MCKINITQVLINKKQKHIIKEQTRKQECAQIDVKKFTKMNNSNFLPETGMSN